LGKSQALAFPTNRRRLTERKFRPVRYFKDTTMTKSDTNELIDLGSASVETKGLSTQYPADDMNQHKPTPGLAKD
jgi:hypothetical protein